MADEKDDGVLSKEQILEDFMRLVKADVRPEDEQTHHDLAVAYEELGLLEEALHEYRLALACRRAKGE